LKSPGLRDAGTFAGLRGFMQCGSSEAFTGRGKGRDGMKKAMVGITAAVLLWTAGQGFGRDKRVNQVPNGNRFSCSTCHTGQGGPRNSFGLLIQGGFLTAPGSAGNVIWDPTLAGLDADGDGFTNGVELQDPDGAWSAGNPNPGTAALVTNPGNTSSKPATGVLNPDESPVPGVVRLVCNYPNPFNASTRLQIRVSPLEPVHVGIYDMRGTCVWEKAAMSDLDGRVELSWSGNDLAGNPLVSGSYLLVAQSAKETVNGKMLMLK
jgi:hypothetical protein